jgi:hypothetical protein
MANTFYLDNFTNAFDADVSVDALTLTLSFEGATYRSDVNWDATALALTLAVNDVIIRHSIIVDTGALTLALHMPTVRWSSSVSPTKLDLTAAVVSPTPSIVTRIIRKTYWFGSVEQVTASKLNNLVDTAVWEISNQAAGDMFYYEGTDPDVYKRIPAGSEGEVLTMSSGVPTWQ